VIGIVVGIVFFIVVVRSVLSCARGYLFFGSADRLAKMFLTVTTGPREGQVQYCILSFARVVFIDASAAQQVKASVDKAARSGCQVLFCRMNEQVYNELSVVKAFRSPDHSVYQALRARGADANDIMQFGVTGIDTAGVNSIDPHLTRRATEDFNAVGSGIHDAFDTESDALDYCNDKLVDQYCYTPRVDWFKIAYRQACLTGSRLDEACFEAMGGLPEGTLGRLRPFCVVHDRMEHYTVLEGLEPTLWFIMRGAIAQLDKLSEEDLLVSDGGQFAAEVKGFSGRGGKRLRCRLTPGHVAGKVSFFLDRGVGLVDKEIIPFLQVSSRIAGYAEVWALTTSKWNDMPLDLRALLLDALISHMADDRQHSYLTE